MGKLIYPIRVLEHGLMSNYPESQTPGGYSPDLLNVRVNQHSIKGRYGHGTSDRNLEEKVYNVILYQLAMGSRKTMYLTETNLAHKEPVTNGETFSYKTEVYTDGDVTNIVNNSPSSGKATVTGSSTVWTSAMEGDEFILNKSADYTADEEPQGNWATIETRNSNTEIILDQNYTGTTGSHTNNYIIRRVYSVPTNSRWSYVLMNDALYFSNGNVNVQAYTGSNYAGDLDATNAVEARYMIEYANRLVLADLEGSGSVRDPWLVKWSDENDPTAWTGYTSGSVALLESEDYITGLGKVGAKIVVYKRESIHVGQRTGVPGDPIAFPIYRRGVGCMAPHSIAEILGTNAFLGKDDFYWMEGDTPRPLSRNKARYKFFDLTSRTEAEQTWHLVDTDKSEIHWIVDTSSGQYDFVWNYQDDEWTIYQYGIILTGAGKGHKPR